VASPNSSLGACPVKILLNKIVSHFARKEKHHLSDEVVVLSRFLPVEVIACYPVRDVEKFIKLFLLFLL
jgi:hypothetical protein